MFGVNYPRGLEGKMIGRKAPRKREETRFTVDFTLGQFTSSSSSSMVNLRIKQTCPKIYIMSSRRYCEKAGQMMARHNLRDVPSMVVMGNLGAQCNFSLRPRFERYSLAD